MVVFTPLPDMTYAEEFKLVYSPGNDNEYTIKVEVEVVDGEDNATLDCIGNNCVWPGDMDNNGIVDDILVYMLAEELYLLVVNASNLDKDYKWLSENNSFDCLIENKSSEYSLLAVQGPDSIKLLSKLTNENLEEIKYYNFIKGNLSKIDDVIISRTGYTGEFGFELYVKNNDAIKLWNSLFSTSVTIKPIGLAARDTLRLEKGFCLYGNDINDKTSPLEANLGWITKLNTNFINSDNLQKQKVEGLNKYQSIKFNYYE
mgnify:CR=1 FL=1